MNLIPQTWTYNRIPFGVGRPELVGTLPELRNRGPIRRQFDEVHRWSTARGDLLQAITGIPFYYRQFGYETALDLDAGRSGFEMNMPVLETGGSEPYILRSARLTDLPFTSEVYDNCCLRYPVSCVRDAAVWEYELHGRSGPVGLLRHWPTLGKAGIFSRFCELKPGVSWLEVAPSVVRYLWKTGQDYARREGRPCTTFSFEHGKSHVPSTGLCGKDFQECDNRMHGICG